MGDENLRANEQSMATELESILSEAISAFPSKIDTSLVESNDGFRYLHVTTRVIPESLVDTIAKLESEFMVRSREDHVAGKVLLECSIPDGAWKQGELPEDYKRAFTIEVQSDSSIPRVDSANSTFPNNDVANGSSLLLSGGGFRATLFHLGVIRNLRKNQQLGNIKEVFSISGGSIAASHLAKRWDDYTGTEVQFKAAAKELVDFTKKGIREDIVRKYAIVWLIPLLLLTLTVSCSIYFSNYVSWPVVTALVGLAVASFWLLERNLRPVISLEKAYQKLLKTKKTSQISDKAPKFFFLATNLTTGNISCFGNKVFFPNVEESKSIEQQETVESDLIKLSQCVAASSAFPPLFSPYPLDLKQLIGDKKGTGIHYSTIWDCGLVAFFQRRAAK